MKVIAKHIFSIINKSRAQRCGCNKADALPLKKDWGNKIKNNREKTIEEFSEASKVPIEHTFNSHANCSSEWCFKTISSEEGNTYYETDEKFRCKKKLQPAVQSPEKDSFAVSNKQSSKRVTAYV